MIIFPPAKINLGLEVLGKRDDGYHEIISCLYSIPLYDVIEILPSESFSFFSYGIEIDGESANNLVVKAYQMMVNKFNIPPVQIHLLKNIPMGAGLGGGSSDAAYTLKALNEMFGLNLSENQLIEMATQLGSDCPFFIKEIPQLATGRGEKLEDFAVSLKGCYIKLIYPGIHVSTKDAYSDVKISDGESIRKTLNQSSDLWKNNLVNTFEVHIFEMHPQLAKIKEQLYTEGSIYASMTGSGSAVYGIYKEKPTITFPNFFERIFKLSV